MSKTPNYLGALPPGLYKRLSIATKNPSVEKTIKDAMVIGAIVTNQQVDTITDTGTPVGPQPIPPAGTSGAGVSQDPSTKAIDQMNSEAEEKEKEVNPPGDVTKQAKNNNWWGELDEWAFENPNWSPYISVIKIRSKLSDISGKMGTVNFDWDEENWSCKAVDDQCYFLGYTHDEDKTKTQKELLDECEIKVFGDISTSGDIYDPKSMHDGYVEDRKRDRLMREEQEKNKDQ